MRKIFTNRWMAITAVLMALLLTVAGCSNASEFTPPSASTIDDAPVELTAGQLWEEFQADPAGTKAKYAGKKLHFARVNVETMSFLGEPPDTDLFVQEGLVKFRIAVPAHLQPVREGYVVEIVGELWDMQYAYLIVRDCWLRVVDPPGGDPNPPPEY
jgi:hypothetical protein